MKKTMLIILMIVAMSVAICTANAYNIIVHVTGSGNGWYEMNNNGTHHAMNWMGTPYLPQLFNDSWFDCFGSNGENSDSDSGYIYHYQDNHFYLDLSDGAHYDPTIPQNE